jgi:hypothetical protein
MSPNATNGANRGHSDITDEDCMNNDMRRDVNHRAAGKSSPQPKGSYGLEATIWMPVLKFALRVPYRVTGLLLCALAWEIIHLTAIARPDKYSDDTSV